MPLKQLLNQLVNKTAQVVKGKVVDVSETDVSCTVDPLDGSSRIYRVQLAAVTGTTGFVVFPAINSDVLVLFINGNDCDGFIVATSEVESLKFTNGNTAMEIGNEIHLGYTPTNFAVLGNELRGELLIERSRIDAIINAIASSPIASQDGGASFKSGLVAQTSSLNKGDFSGILSDIVKIE